MSHSAYFVRLVLVECVSNASGLFSNSKLMVHIWDADIQILDALWAVKVDTQIPMMVFKLHNTRRDMMGSLTNHHVDRGYKYIAGSWNDERKMSNKTAFKGHSVTEMFVRKKKNNNTHAIMKDQREKKKSAATDKMSSMLSHFHLDRCCTVYSMFYKQLGRFTFQPLCRAARFPDTVCSTFAQELSGYRDANNNKNHDNDATTRIYLLSMI